LIVVHINPLDSTINLGQWVDFTSSVTGGTTSYRYQWYLDGNPVSGATSSTWRLTPSTVGIYYVYLIVTDANNNTGQSETARVLVVSVPVGGYSVSFSRSSTNTSVAVYTAFLAMFGAAAVLIRRKIEKAFA
jgi:hypothetical protein